MSCSKVVLADVFPQDREEQAHRIYAIVDDQSNASMISTDLTDILGVQGPKEKYYLSTCSTEKEMKYGRRVYGLALHSSSGKLSKLPTLMECNQIPQSKDEIPTPEIAREFRHLQDIADKIPPIDQNAKIHILIGRDAPKLLKVRAFKNGPKGAPWAQKLDLGWTIPGQACLDREGGPIHIPAHRMTVTSTGENSYEFTPCPNHFLIKERYAECKDGLGNDVYQTTGDDNEVSMLWDDRRFLDIMKRSVHKNQQGNWEMPLPFCSENVCLPNNRSLALRRLDSLVRSFKRRPKLKGDYCEFLRKIIDRRHATPIPPNEHSQKPETFAQEPQGSRKQWSLAPVKYGISRTLGFTTQGNQVRFAWFSIHQRSSKAHLLTKNCYLDQI